MRLRPWPTLAAVLALALVATGALAYVQARHAADERARVDALQGEIDRLRAEVDDLQDELAASPPAEEAEDPADPDGGSDLDVDELLESFGGLDGLLGGSVPGQACLTPEGAGGLDGLFDGLFDAEPGDPGDLDDLFGDLFGGGSTLPDDPDELVEVISDQVAELRELSWQEPVSAEFIDSAELHDRLEAILDEDLDPEELDASERLLTALGAIPADADLEQLQRDLLDDQVAGYYVPDTGELVVRVPDDGQLRTLDKVTLAHELDHALTDQVLGIPDRSEPPFAGDADASLAVLSVIEGDATLVMNQWALAELSLTDQLGMAMDPGVAGAQAAMDKIPHYLQQELLFPYTEGLDWVCDVYLEGGWEAVDAAYADPPATSAEVLWGEPVLAAVAGEVVTPEGFDALTSTTVGAAHLSWLFEAPGGDAGRGLEDPEGRARGWGGGEVTTWGREADTAVGLALTDRGTGSQPLCDSIEDWYDAAFPETQRSTDGALTTFDGDQQAAALRCADDDVVLGIAPSIDDAVTIAGG